MLPELDGVINRKNANLGLYKRFPAKSLHTFVLRRYGDAKTAASILGIKRATVSAWGHTGQTFYTYYADQVACRLGVHPSVIWPEWFDIDPEQEEKVCRRREQNRKRSEARKAMLLQ